MSFYSKVDDNILSIRPDIICPACAVDRDNRFSLRFRFRYKFREFFKIIFNFFPHLYNMYVVIAFKKGRIIIVL